MRLPSTPAAAVDIPYGEYLVTTTGCRTCHGQGLSGNGRDPNPKAPAAPDLTQRGQLQLWIEETFIAQARSRSSEFMPWKLLSRMRDDELRAI